MKSWWIMSHHFMCKELQNIYIYIIYIFININIGLHETPAV